MTSRKADSVAWQQALGGVRVPRGVHRFKPHEEAEQSQASPLVWPRPK